MQLKAPGQFPDPGILSQHLWIRWAPNRQRVRQATWLRNLDDRSEHGEVSSSGVGKASFATRSSSYLLSWSNSRPRSARPAVETSTISRRWSRKCTQGRTWICSSVRVFSTTTTSSLSRGSMKPLYLSERPSSTSSEAWSVQKPITCTPCRCTRIFSVRASMNICSSTSWATSVCWPTCSRCSKTARSTSTSLTQPTSWALHNSRGMPFWNTSTNRSR